MGLQPVKVYERPTTLACPFPLYDTGLDQDGEPDFNAAFAWAIHVELKTTH
jgi:hypothetical protein